MKFITVGDIHGKFSGVHSYIERNYIEDTYIFLAGDLNVGLGDENTIQFQTNELILLNELCKSRHIHMYGIRGNHDNPKYFDGKHFNFSNLKLVPDYTIVTLPNDERVLLVGGAVSVDRQELRKMELDWIKKNKMYKLWFFDEKFILNKDFLRGYDCYGINHVITHTAPNFCFPDQRFGFPEFILEHATNDPGNLLEALREERKQVADMYDILCEMNFIQTWHYGHFHKAHTDYNNGTKFRCCAEMEFVIEYNKSDYE